MPNWARCCAYPLAANQKNRVTDHQALLRRADWPAGLDKGAQVTAPDRLVKTGYASFSKNTPTASKTIWRFSSRTTEWSKSSNHNFSFLVLPKAA